MSVLACTLLLSFGRSAPGSAMVRADGARLVVNEALVFALRTAQPEARVAALARRMDGYRGPGNIGVKSFGPQRTILLDGRPLLAVSPAEARARSTSVPALAAEWSIRLRKALQLPEVRLADEYARMPVRTTRTIQILGREARTAKLEIIHPTVVRAERIGNQLKITGLAPGTATVSLQGSVSLDTVEVEVRDVAASFPIQTETVVTGGPATVATIRGAIEASVKALFRNRPGLRTSFSYSPRLGLNPGQSAVYRVPVSASAPNTYPVKGEVLVKVKNVGLDRQEEEVLWYSNDPESIKQPGSLFAVNLAVGKAARLLYHHQNASGNLLMLRLQAVNDSDETAKLMIIPGDSRPTRNPVRAGLSAGDQYMRNWVYGSGEIVTIPPRSSLPISLRRLYAEDTASGLCSLRLLEGLADLLVRCDAWPAFQMDARWSAALSSSTPWREVGANPILEIDRAPFTLTNQIFPNPIRREEVTYSVGGRHGFVRMGQRPIPRLDGDATHSGNFGVVYNIKTRLQNPTSQPVEVELVFEASAGYTAGFFVFNGRTVRSPLLAPKAEFQIAQLKLAPGESRSIDMVTMPLSGSSYPATFKIRPVVASNQTRSTQYR